MKITVLGCGRWGSFIAWYLDSIGNDVTVYGRASSARFEKLKTERKNDYVAFPERIRMTSDLAFALSGAEVCLCSVSAQGLRAFLSDPGFAAFKQESEAPLVLCMKGLEEGAGKRLSVVAEECGFPAGRIAVWLGPGHIQDFTAGIPNCMVIDSKNEALAVRLCEAFKGPLIRFYYGCDLIGNEIGAAAKNVMGIAAGMLDGLGLSTLKGPLMARGAHEVSRLIGAEGGKELSAYGLCHLGDYETTLFSHYSNNRAYGEAFVKKQPFLKLAEGVATARAMRLLAKRDGVELPICEAVCRILFEGEDAKAVLLSLFERKSKAEFPL